ncbi:hypothetical protein JCM10213_009093 [Rhodosporidiobolus nylandii]
MPVPSLPFELINFIFSYLVSPISLAPPSFYRDLCSAALVCRNWTAPAQSLLWEQVCLSKGDKQIEKWLGVDHKAGLWVKALVLVKGRDEQGLRAKYTTEVLLRLFARCGGISSLNCDLWLRDVCEAVPDFVRWFFPNLRSFGVAYSYRQYGQQQSPALPLGIRTLLVRGQPVQNMWGLSYAAYLALEIAKDYEAGRFPLLNRVEVADLAALPPLQTLAPALRTLVLPRVQLAAAASRADLSAFLAVCSNLTRLVIPLLWDASLVEAVPPSLTHLEVGTVTGGAFRAFCVDFERLARSWTSVVELRIQDLRNDERLQDTMELWEQVEESCASRGIEVVMSGR